MKPAASRLSVDHQGARALVVTGVIDSHTADDLLDDLRSLGTDADITIDLAGIDFIDSSGLRTILTVHQELDEAGQRLVLLGLSDPVRRLVEITGLEAHLHLG